MPYRHSPRDTRKAQVLGLLHLRSTPRMAEVVTWGYDLKTPSGRRDNCATALLSLLLIVTAVTVSGLTNSMQLIYIQADLCDTREGKLAANMDYMRNITNYDDARAASSEAVNITATAYYDAKDYYNILGLRFRWPAPYDLSEEERQKLETEARLGGDDCESVEECVGGVTGFVGDIFGEQTCAEVEVPCPDIESTELLVEYDSSQKSLDLFGNNATDFNREGINTSLAQEALDEATHAISELVRRINFASSIYVLYMAFLVIVTPPFIVYGAKWNQRIFDCLANVNKPLWIAFIVIAWYTHELFQSIVNSSLYKVIWGNFLKDPCWADPDFLVNTSLVIRDTCTDIASAHNLFNQAAANYRYYDQVETTWMAVVPEESLGPFYGDPEVDFPQDFPGNCSATTLLTAIQPGDGSVNWWALFFHSGALVALLLQLVLAHWFLSWFSVLRPLTMHRGRVMIPESSQGDEQLYREVRSFARRRAILPFLFTTAVLLFLLVNLGASSSDEDMPRKVLIGAFLLAFLQLGIIPLLIWRPVDERTMPKSNFVASHRLGPSNGEGGGVTATAAGMGAVAAGGGAAAVAQQRGREAQPEWEDEEDSDEWEDSEEGARRSLSPVDRTTSSPLFAGNGVPTSQYPSYGEQQHQEQKMEMPRVSSSDSLSSILQSAMAATANAAAVGEGRRQSFRWTRAGVNPGEIFKLLEMDQEGRVLCRDGKKKVYNAMAAIKDQLYSSPEDAANFLATLQSEPGLFVERTFDTTGRLENVFWATVDQQNKIARYGACIQMDTTVFTNKYGCPLLFIVGVDDENRSCVLAQCLLRSECTETFEWILTCWDGASGGRRPKVFLTDGDRAMTAALRGWKTTLHLYCLWHIFKNVLKNCGSSFPDIDERSRMLGLFRSAAYAATPEAFNTHSADLERTVAGKACAEYIQDLIEDKTKHYFAALLRFLGGVYRGQSLGHDFHGSSVHNRWRKSPDGDDEPWSVSNVLQEAGLGKDWDGRDEGLDDNYEGPTFDDDCGGEGVHPAEREGRATDRKACDRRRVFATMMAKSKENVGEIMKAVSSDQALHIQAQVDNYVRYLLADADGDTKAKNPAPVKPPGRPKGQGASSQTTVSNPRALKDNTKRTTRFKGSEEGGRKSKKIKQNPE
eukprot:g18414.t1